MMQIFGFTVPAVNWDLILKIITASGFLFASFSTVIAVLRLNRVKDALDAFRAARSELTGIVDAIDRLDTVASKFKRTVTDLNEDAESLNRTEKRIIDIQQNTFISNTGQQEQTELPRIEQKAEAESHWQNVRTSWRRVRDDIEERIDSLDGRMRRPFAKMPRYSYKDIIEKLISDGDISSGRGEAALNMNNRFLVLRRNPSNTTLNDANDFDRWETQFKEKNY